MARSSEANKSARLALALSVGTVISANIVGGIVLGYLLDRWLHTGPWLVLAGLVLGTINAVIGLFRVVARLNRTD